jgi:Tfp pilus assembly protein PilX
MNLDTTVEMHLKLERAESALRTAQTKLQQATERAALAEKSARDAWAFARTIMRTGAHDHQGHKNRGAK